MCMFTTYKQTPRWFSYKSAFKALPFLPEVICIYFLRTLSVTSDRRLCPRRCFPACINMPHLLFSHNFSSLHAIPQLQSPSCTNLVWFVVGGLFADFSFL